MAVPRGWDAPGSRVPAGSAAGSASVQALDVRAASPYPSSLFLLLGNANARPPGFRKSDRNRLLGVLGAVLPLTDVADLLVDVLSSARRGGVAAPSFRFGGRHNRTSEKREKCRDASPSELLSPRLGPCYDAPWKI